MPVRSATLPDAVVDLGRRAREASRALAVASTDTKNNALLVAAELLGERAPEILEANAGDLDTARSEGVGGTPLDRLRLDEERLESMAAGLRTVAGLEDPVGEIVGGTRRANGVVIEKVRVPLGVLAIIYENRPNVTSDAAGLCLKSGNASLLRGSSTALRSNTAVAAVLRAAARKAGLPEDSVLLVEDTSHETAAAVMQLEGYVDCLIPRGGPALLASIAEHATVPVIVDGDGNCQVYVDKDADLDTATRIVVNAKTQRPSVCNAAESLIVHADIAGEFLPRVASALVDEGVTLVGDDAARAIVSGMGSATDADFSREFLALEMSVGVVASLDAAIDHVNRHSSGHTEAIVTTELAAARQFAERVDAAAIVVNASTRFTDGEFFGFGAEIGISTQKLHARGPMGLRELTTTKYLLWGDGQVRE
ncbi:MAG: glutamate-5-semialdehyde dehydrogenase [Acidimicrobiia bacterium]